ncbi:hypothetical protein QFC22_004838 [Naganishia vaughanmartiniae]|uniref:Uncharacterized protein n=1 Tax=Naganishia vaughanmartiniae TaxID=1424756 RepID=A0ACC2X004_9TREE|nr:hypothetical protein QFC22_004838 [Naganishia vaughanmartiniae]
MLPPLHSSSSDNDDREDPNAEHLLYILLDSNLPTGGFVASSGLESYAKHGFLRSTTGTTNVAHSAASLVHYVQESVVNYSASTVPFVRDSWELLRTPEQEDTEEDEEGKVGHMVEQVKRLDALYDAVTLNHVTRRSSTAQGIALLTLYTKAFAEPLNTKDDDDDDNNNSDEQRNRSSSQERMRRMGKERGTLVIERIKKLIRRGETAGHLPVCWGLITSAAGLSLGCLEAEVRRALAVGVGTGLLKGAGKGVKSDVGNDKEEESDWAWAEEAEQQVMQHLHVYQQTQNAPPNTEMDHSTEAGDGGWTGPTMVWPLGEIIMARHDFQHTRIFNS